MKLTELPLPGLYRIDTLPRTDDRGRFTRIVCDEALAAIRPGLSFRQVNVSETFRRGTVRGMHFQVPPAAEAKLIRCLRGRVFDVAVDLRKGSPTYLSWNAIELGEGSDSQVFIPEGFAHGFQALSDDVQLLYFHTAPWQPAHERRVHCQDPRIAIRWPLPVMHLSPADAVAPRVDGDFEGFRP